MRNEVKEILAKAMKVEVDYIQESNSADIYDFLMCSKEVQVEVISENRWWNDVEIVVELDGNYIMYCGASTTGDRTPDEVGYEQPSLDDITQVHKQEITQTVYR